MNRSRIAAAVLTAASAVGIALASAGAAAATPPSPHVEPGGIIRIDVAPGEWWNCQAISPSWPLVAYAPGLYQYALGPNQIIFNQFPPGSQVWVSCNGTGLPVIYYGPILTTI